MNTAHAEQLFEQLAGVRTPLDPARASVIRDRYVKAAPRHEQGEPAYALPIARAFERTYTTDAHFVQYTSPLGRRLSREALDAGTVAAIGIITIDVDCPDVHGTAEPASAAWRESMREKLAGLAAVHAAPYYYETRGGARVVYRLAEPMILRSQADAQSWSQQYQIAISYLSRRFGIDGDRACGDWTRLFRLPHATRDRAHGPERWPVFGDSERIGVLTFDPSAEDVAAVEQRVRKARVLDFEPCAADGYGLLFHALRARGAILRQRAPNAFVIRCPRESTHSCGRTGDGATLVYLPAYGEQVGHVHCLHSHCAGLRVSEWLSMFSRAELDAARRAAGIERIS